MDVKLPACHVLHITSMNYSPAYDSDACAGEFFNAPLGNVYAEDEDDWDVENKTFAFVDSEQERFFKYDICLCSCVL